MSTLLTEESFSTVYSESFKKHCLTEIWHVESVHDVFITDGTAATVETMTEHFHYTLSLFFFLSLNR